MPAIQILDPSLAAQVAAGEVIESPAAVVRELVDNALDAQATQIDVQLEQGGRGRILVRDNGHGLAKEDLKLAFERHATSKLQHANQLTNIQSLGFRGEALPSIAAVARLRLRSKFHQAEQAWETQWAGGEHLSLTEAAPRAGTSIEVEELFFNLPARRKFLGTAAAQSRAVDRLLRQQALAFPEVAFSFKLDGKLHWQRPAKQSFAGRASLLVPDAEELWPVDCTLPQVGQLHGLISPPAQGRKSQEPQYFVLRRRVVESPLLKTALRRAYQAQGLAEQPIALLHLQPDPQLLIDWNVHPAKREVRFAQNQLVEESLTKALTEALAQGSGQRSAQPSPPKSPSPTPSADNAPPTSTPTPPQPVLTSSKPHPASSTRIQELAPQAYASKNPSSQEPTTPPKAELPQLPQAPELPQALRRQEEQLPLPTLEAEVPASKTPPSLNQNSPSPRWLGLLPPEFALLEQQSGLLIADLRAVLERLAAERLQPSHATNTPAASQSLLLPLSAQLQSDQFERLMNAEASWQTQGWQLEEFGPNTVLVRAVPAAWPTLEEAELPQLLEELSSKPERWQSRQFRAWASAMLKQNQPLAAETAQSWMEELWQSHQPYLTPSGRATVWWITERELARRFARS